MRVVTYFTDVDDETIWAYIENQGRACWYGIKGEDLEEVEPKDADILAVVKRDDFDPAKLPHVEDQDEVIQDLWKNISESENCMWFVENEDTQPDPIWNVFDISQEEYERRVDAAIEKYHLEDVIEKDGDPYLYTCYGDLQSAFSEEYKI